MSREKKAQIIERLQEVFSGCRICILADYRGMTTAAMTVLRRKLEESGIEYEVVKNTLARFAAEKAGRSDLLDLFTGPVSLASSYGDDVTAPAKILSEYIDAAKVTLAIRGGFLGDRRLSAEEVLTLAKLSSREVLVAKVVGGIQAPIYGLVNSLASPLRGLMMVLQSRIQQLEG